MTRKRPTPPKPADLTPEGDRRWRDIWTSAAAATWDRDTAYAPMVRYIKLFDTWVRYAESVRQAPMVNVGTGKGRRSVPNPAERRVLAIERELQALENQWGLAPAAAMKLGIPASTEPDPAPDSLEELLAVVEREVVAKIDQAGSNQADRQMLARVRAYRALQMRLDGWPNTKIALVLGMSEGGVRRAVQRALRSTGIEPARDQVLMAVKRLERVIEHAMPLVLAGDTKAMREVRESQSEITKLLGLNAPQKVEISVAEIERDTRDQARALGLTKEEEDDAVRFVLEHLGFDTGERV